MQNRHNSIYMAHDLNWVSTSKQTITNFVYFGFVQFSVVLEHVSDVTLREKTGLSLQLQVRNEQCLQRSGRSSSLIHENHASPWQRLVSLVNFRAPKC